MKFYIATVDGRRVLHHRQDEAKAADKNFEKIDIPTDMAGLKAFVQELFDTIDNKHPAAIPLGADHDVPFNRGGVEEAGFLPEPPTGGPGHSMPAVHDREPNFEEDEDNFNASILESQVEALGTLGDKGLEFFDGWSAINGISHAFARGVMLLNVIAADEHQLARTFLRDRLKKRKVARV